MCYTIPTLWTNIRLGPPQFTPDGLSFLQDRLTRARNRRLHVTIRVDDSVDQAIRHDACALLATHSCTIDTLHLSSDLNYRITPILRQIVFQDNATPSTVTCLTLDTDDFYETYDDDTAGIQSPNLAMRMDLLPALRSLSFTATRSSLPTHLGNARFENLTTLVIAEPFISTHPGIYFLCAFLSCTPHLETLYCKIQDIWETFNYRGSTVIDHFRDIYPDVSLPILLPRLTTAAVTVTGTGGDILSYIHAPALRNLHLDGSRSDLVTDAENYWCELLNAELLSTLRLLAPRSPNLRRLAITEAFLSEPTWRWLVCGGPLPVSEGELRIWSGTQPPVEITAAGVPFPHLETLAVRDFGPTRSCGLDDAVLRQFGANPGLTTLRCLILRRCLDISGDVLISALLSSMGGRSSEVDRPETQAELELEIVACPGIDEGHRAAMESAGMRVKWEPDREDLNAHARRAEHQWWEARREMVLQTLEYTQEDWETEPSRDEEPWWILDVKSLDPTDTRVF